MTGGGAEFERPDRLNVEDVLGLVSGAEIEVGVVWNGKLIRLATGFRLSTSKVPGA
jgi:hypothetical protein